jgi:hypothetical protein
MQRHHLERVLIVAGNRHCGKSTQLSSMFRDIRLATRGSIPKDRKLADFYRLTNDRFLYLRLSSPHELKETPRGFLKKAQNKIKVANPEFVSPLPARSTPRADRPRPAAWTQPFRTNPHPQQSHHKQRKGKTPRETIITDVSTPIVQNN